jgi:hypothetical protein
MASEQSANPKLAAHRERMAQERQQRAQAWEAVRTAEEQIEAAVTTLTRAAWAIKGEDPSAPIPPLSAALFATNAKLHTLVRETMAAVGMIAPEDV